MSMGHGQDAHFAPIGAPDRACPLIGNSLTDNGKGSPVRWDERQ